MLPRRALGRGQAKVVDAPPATGLSIEARTGRDGGKAKVRVLVILFTSMTPRAFHVAEREDGRR